MKSFTQPTILFSHPVASFMGTTCNLHWAELPKMGVVFTFNPTHLVLGVLNLAAGITTAHACRITPWIGPLMGFSWQFITILFCFCWVKMISLSGQVHSPATYGLNLKKLTYSESCLVLLHWDMLIDVHQTNPINWTNFILLALATFVGKVSIVMGSQCAYLSASSFA